MTGADVPGGIDVAEAFDLIEQVMRASGYNPTAQAAIAHARNVLAERDQLAAELAEARETIAAQEVYRNAHRESIDKIHAAAVRVNADLTAVRNMLADCVVKATEYGTQDGEFVAMYLLPTGPIHRAIPYLDGVGINVRPGFDGRKTKAADVPATSGDGA